jgi:leader peptidase (prepilin peptidase)/N-methyltransferase
LTQRFEECTSGRPGQHEGMCANDPIAIDTMTSGPKSFGGDLRLTTRQSFSAAIVALLAVAASELTGAAEPLAVRIFVAGLLSWAAFIDIDRFTLPDSLTFGLIGSGFLWCAFTDRADFINHFVAAGVAYGGLAAVAYAYRRRRGFDGLGGGDAKLLAGAGAWLGWEALPFILLMASLAGIAAFLLIAARERRFDPGRPIPFGPFLALATWMAWLVLPLWLNLHTV